MVGVVRIWADGPLNCLLDGGKVVGVLRLDDGGYREQSHVGSMKDWLGVHDADASPSGFRWREGRDSNRLIPELSLPVYSIGPAPHRLHRG